MTGELTLAGARYRYAAVVSDAPRKGQDRILARDGFVGVADGSTPLLDEHEIDAGGFAEEVLESLYEHRTASGMRELVRASLGEPAQPPPKVTETATCTFCVLRDLDTRWDAAVLGDCLVVAALDGEVVAMSDERLSTLDREAAEQLAAEIQAGATAEEAWAAIHPLLLANRLAANQEGSYWLYAGDAAVADEVISRTFEGPPPDTALLCTDGFRRLIDPFRVVEGPGELLAAAREQGLEPLVEQLRALERETESLVRFPRLQVHDDAAAVLLERFPSAVG